MHLPQFGHEYREVNTMAGKREQRSNIRLLPYHTHFSFFWSLKYLNNLSQIRFCLKSNGHQHADIVALIQLVRQHGINIGFQIRPAKLSQCV